MMAIKKEIWVNIYERKYALTENALTHLMKEGRVKRVRAFGIDGIGYFYEDCHK